MSSANFGRWGALAAMVGGALWALFPFGTPIAESAEPGTSAYPASVAYYGLMAVIPLLLLLVGLAGLYVGQRGNYGRLGRVGFPVSILALGLMFTGNAVEVTSITFRGSESAVGHFTFLIGFLLLLVTIVGTIKEALKLSYAAIELPRDGGFKIAAATGEPPAAPLRVPLTYQGEAVGRLSVGPRAPGEELSAADRRLLDSK